MATFSKPHVPTAGFKPCKRNLLLDRVPREVHYPMCAKKFFKYGYLKKIGTKSGKKRIRNRMASLSWASARAMIL